MDSKSSDSNISFRRLDLNLWLWYLALDWVRTRLRPDGLSSAADYVSLSQRIHTF
jgi:hypothetical protein